MPKSPGETPTKRTREDDEEPQCSQATPPKKKRTMLQMHLYHFLKNWKNLCLKLYLVIEL